MYEAIQYENEDGVGVLTLERPQTKNAVDAVMRRELPQLMGALNTDRTLKVLIVTGAGGNFCSGGDLRAVRDSAGSEGSAEGRRQRILDGQATPGAFLNFDRPVIAVVEGVAYGAGCSLALTADMVLAARDARFCLSFGRIGAVPDYGAFYTLPRIVGLQRAKELVFSAREFGAAEARDLGIVMEVHEPGTVLDRAREIARSMAQASPLALSVSTRALNTSLHSDLPTMLMHEADGQGIAMSTDYHLTAVRRFLDKEPPLFSWPRRRD